VSFGPTGDLYAVALAFITADNPNASAILVSKSVDLGETWSAPVTIAEDATGGLDKESITADPADPSTVYATWDRIVTPGGSSRASDQGIFNSRSYKAQTFFSRSTDGGATWEAPQPLFTNASFSGSIGGIVRPLGDGETLLDGLVTYGSGSWKGGPCASVSVLRSTDRGTSWGTKPVSVAPFSCTYFGAHDPDTGALVRSGVDGSTAYVTWEDALPSAPTTGRILFSQSADGGITWSSPTVVSRTPPGVDALVPTIAVDAGHRVGISYYDFRSNTPGGIAATDLWLTRCAASCSDSASWSEVRVTPSSFDLSAAPQARGLFLGDYMGMTTHGTTFEPFFTQSGSPPAVDGATDAFFASLP
jgi:hypothetical protein